MPACAAFRQAGLVERVIGILEVADICYFGCFDRAYSAIDYRLGLFGTHSIIRIGDRTFSFDMDILRQVEVVILDRINSFVVVDLQIAVTIVGVVIRPFGFIMEIPKCGCGVIGSIGDL